MSTEAFLYLKKNFKDDFEKIYTLKISVQDFRTFHYRKKVRKRKRTKKQLYGEELVNILKWLNENCHEPYYPRFDSKLGKNSIIEFFFMSEEDAMAFKLTFK